MGLESQVQKIAQGYSSLFKVGEVKVKIRALKYDDTQALPGVHPNEQILGAFEHGRVHDVKRRIFEYTPPVCRRFLDDPHGAAGFVLAMVHLLRPRQSGTAR